MKKLLKYTAIACFILGAIYTIKNGGQQWGLPVIFAAISLILYIASENVKN